MTPPQPPEPLTQKRIKELAKIIDAYECPHDYFLCADCREEIADALDKLAKVEAALITERDYWAEDSYTYKRLDAILALLVAAGQKP